MRLLTLSAALAMACASPSPHPRAVEQVRRGYAHLAAGDRERAEVAFEHALEMAPDLAEARNGLGIALRLAGRDGEALRQFEAAVAADPDLAEGHANLADLLAAAGKPDLAAEAAAEALAIDPDQPAARLTRARWHEARAGAATGPDRERRLDLARRDLLHLLEARPDLPRAWEDLGRVAFLRGDLEEASAAFARAARLDPAAAESLHGLCVARGLAGDAAGALRACRRCRALDPGNPRCSRSLAAAEALSGAPPGAALP